MNLPVKIHQGQWLLIMIGVLLSLHLTGCTSSRESTEFPVGLFDCVQCPDTQIRYVDDGTLVVYSHGEKWFTGKWYVEGDIFYTGDSFCFDKDTMPASYKWDFDDEILTLEVIQDECSDRVDSLDGKPWRLIKGQ